MTFGWTTMFGVGIEVKDIYFGTSEDDPNPKKFIWLVFHLPFCRVGFII